MMQLVIDIPEIDYKQGTLGDVFRCYSRELNDIIYNGIVLPKGHGRLIDADKLKPEAHYIREDGVAVYVPAVPIMKVVNAPTIIRADKAESEDQNG